MIFTILAIFLRWESVVSFAFLWMVYKVFGWLQNPLRRIPGPRGSIIFGNMHQLAPPNDAQQVFLKWRKEYGEVFKTWTLLAGYYVHISNPDHLKKILVKEPKNYDRPNIVRMQLKEISSNNGISLFDVNGKSHALQRKILNPAFSYANVQKFIHIFQTKADELVKFWNNKISENNGHPIAVDIQIDFNRLTLDVLGESAFDYKFNSIGGFNNEESQATDRLLRCAFDLRRKGLEILFPFLRFFPSKSKEEAKSTSESFRKTIFNVIRQRREELKNPQSPKKDDLLQLFIEMSEKEGMGLTDEDLFTQVEVFMIAGHESTGIALTWVILHLSKYPDIQSKVQTEIRELIDNNENLTHENLSKLKYMDNCIKESMRLYPSFLHFLRQPLTDIQIGSFIIPKGTLLLLHIGLAHRDERFWERPDVFDPNRFEKPYSGEHQQTFQYQYLPFSRGPRMCIGYRFAETEMKVVLVKLLRSFTFKLGKNQTSDFSAERLLTLRPSPSPEIEISRLD